jgi:hypothetical protein
VPSAQCPVSIISDVHSSCGHLPKSKKYDLVHVRGVRLIRNCSLTRGAAVQLRGYQLNSSRIYARTKAYYYVV